MDRDDQLPLPTHGKPPPMSPDDALRQACRTCHTPTQWATLSQYGARCRSCFEAYVREPRPQAPILPNKPRHGGRAWAYALRDREERGDPLTPTQREMWRAVLRPSENVSGGQP